MMFFNFLTARIFSPSKSGDPLTLAFRLVQHMRLYHDSSAILKKLMPLTDLPSADIQNFYLELNFNAKQGVLTLLFCNCSFLQAPLHEPHRARPSQ